jgi:hypothetical protein
MLIWLANAGSNELFVFELPYPDSIPVQVSIVPCHIFIPAALKKSIHQQYQFSGFPVLGFPLKGVSS